MSFFVGIDPGFSGAIGLINATGTMVKAWPMPVKKTGKTQYNTLDLDNLKPIFKYLRAFPGVRVGMENPTTRPGEEPERAARFGRQLGVLESFCFLQGFPYMLVAPNLWKSRLALPGKEHDPQSAAGLALFRSFYPAAVSTVTGPRGGTLDGPLDALLIAHWMRTTDPSGVAGISTQHGKKSPQEIAVLFGRRNTRKLNLTKLQHLPDPPL